MVSQDLTGRSPDELELSEPVAYERTPTKAHVDSKFSMLRVHPELTIYMKPSRPLATAQQWTKTDEDNCFRVEVLCE